MIIKPVPDQNILHTLFEYKAGSLFWQSREGVPASWNTKYANKRAGTTTPHGMRYIQVEGAGHFEHRLIWGYFFGEIPENYQIGHKDDDKLNNDIDNLDLYEKTELVLLKGHAPQNTAKIKVRGIWEVNGKFRGEFQFRGERYYCGYWDTIEEAEIAYKNKKKQVVSKLGEIL